MEMQLGALLDTTPSRSCSLDIVMEWLYEGLTEVTIWKWLYPGTGHHFLRLSTHPHRLKTYVVLQQVEYLGPEAKGEKRSGLAYHRFQWPTEEFVPPKSATLDCAYLGILVPRVGILPQGDIASVSLNFILRLSPVTLKYLCQETSRCRNASQSCQGLLALFIFRCFAQYG